MEDISVLQQKNLDLIDLMPLDARRVLDVGCSTGEIAKEYQKRASPEYYLGIEIVPEDAAIAREFCSECVVGNIEEFNSQQWNHLSGLIFGYSEMFWNIFMIHGGF